MKKIIYSLLFTLALTSCGNGLNFEDAFKTLTTEDATVEGDHYWYFDVVGSKVPLRLIPSEDGKSLTPEVDVVLNIKEKVNLTEDAIYECSNMKVSMLYESILPGTFKNVKLNEASLTALAEMLKSGKKGKIKLTFTATTPVEATKATEIATQACKFNIEDASFDTSKVSSDDLFDAIFPDTDWYDVSYELEEIIEKALELYDEAKESRSDSDIKRWFKQKDKVDIMLAKVKAAGGEEEIEGHSSTMKLIKKYYEIR